jgi:peptide/nickel transport system ATP-binding protein
LITHDLGVVAETADRVAVMYAGRIVEGAGVRDIFHAPKHPYTEGLLRSVPRLNAEGLRHKRLDTIEGTVPSLLSHPEGCKFAPRCAYRINDCTKGEIPLLKVNEKHLSRCIRYEVVGDEAAKTRATPTSAG